MHPARMPVNNHLTYPLGSRRDQGIAEKLKTSSVVMHSTVFFFLFTLRHACSSKVIFFLVEQKFCILQVGSNSVLSSLFAPLISSKLYQVHHKIC